MRAVVVGVGAGHAGIHREILGQGLTGLGRSMVMTTVA